MSPLSEQSNAPSFALAAELQSCQSRSRRNGKVARLPAELRHQINVMLDDGVLYKTIIERLGDAGKHLNEDNISNWRLGGFQDYRKAQLISDRARTQTQAAADLLAQGAQVNPADLKRVCGEIALLNFLETLLEHGDQLAQDSLKKNPAKMITLINACCNMANSNIALEKHNQRIEDAALANRRSAAAPVEASAPPSLNPASGAPLSAFENRKSEIENSPTQSNPAESQKNNFAG